jgi:hypothetical protein
VALESSEEGVAEAVQKGRLQRVTMRGDVISILESRNCVLDVTQLPEALETSSEGGTEVVKTAGLVRVPVTMRGEVNNIPEC